MTTEDSYGISIICFKWRNVSCQDVRKYILGISRVSKSLELQSSKGELSFNEAFEAAVWNLPVYHSEASEH